MPYKARVAVDIDKLEDEEIMDVVRAREEENGLRLTKPQKRFYLRLIDYAVYNGSHEVDGVTIYLTEKEMTEKFGLSPSMVNKCLLYFRKLGLVLREKSEHDPRGKNTVIPKELYKR